MEWVEAEAEADDDDNQEAPGLYLPPMVELESVDEKIQPIGELCLIICRMSSNKGRTSKKSKNGRSRVQVDQDGYKERRKLEGRRIGDRLCNNAPAPFQFAFLKGTCHKQLSNHYLDWVHDKRGMSQMIVEIKQFFNRLAPKSKVTICIRSLDGLTTNIDSFWTFVRYVVKTKELDAKFIWQLSLYTPRLHHRRMRPFLGLGLVIAFTGKELRDYHRHGIDNEHGDVKNMVKVIWRQGKSKAATNRGLQDRNQLPDANMLGAQLVSDAEGDTT